MPAPIEPSLEPNFDSVAFRTWFALAIDLVARAQVRLDSENLFPVADGDTGANVLATLESGAEALNCADGEVISLARKVARATLIEARGNSGVILSEILRGLADGLERGLGAGLIQANLSAQRAVTRPVNGTILTAMAAGAAAITQQMNDRQAATAAWTAARAAALESAVEPPIPSASGTIDAGAHALERILAALAGTMDPTLQPIEPLPASTILAPTGAGSPIPNNDGAYEVMYLLPNTSTEFADSLRNKLADLGQSVLVVGGDELWNIHVHTDDPGLAIEAGLALGTPNRIKVTALNPGGATEFCVSTRRVIAVANGAGIAEIMHGVGAMVISAFDSRRVVSQEWWQATIGASEVVLLPQDRHGLHSAHEAVSDIRNSGIRVAVIPTRSTVQALAAMAVHDPLRSFDDDVVAMTSAASHTRHATLAFAKDQYRSGQISYDKGDAIGIIDGEIMVAGSDLAQVAENVLNRMLMGGGDLLTLVTGADATNDLANRLTQFARSVIPDLVIAIHDGGQAWYPLLIGVE
ncbi:MAG TPA: DAK2 domain-containing protein [Candidatus Nanopelagicaceae bacterium]|nr:DAK2 domain-containing protein [Candidatus Nanopelagicaceae bacterium]